MITRLEELDAERLRLDDKQIPLNRYLVVSESFARSFMFLNDDFDIAKTQFDGSHYQGFILVMSK